MSLVHERAPLTVAAFMDLALYHPRLGYYARTARCSGRAGDFYTSVDVGALFGDLLAGQIAEMAAILSPDAPFDLVEAGAGNGLLAADLMHALARRAPALLPRTRLHLVEASQAARAAHAGTLGRLAAHLATSSADLPASFEGVLLANELLDALPVHQVVMRDGQLREIYVIRDGDRLATAEGPLSTPALADYFDALAVTLEDGWRAEVNLAAMQWLAAVAERLTRGFIILIDYGHAATELYSAARACGTLTGYRRHTSDVPGTVARPAWLQSPGEQDLTSHVDFTSIQRVAGDAGLTTLGLLDQTYFLLGLLDPSTLDPSTLGSGGSAAAVKRRLALKTLIMPGGLGSTMKVLLLAKGVGTPGVRGCAYRVRLT